MNKHHGLHQVIVGLLNLFDGLMSILSLGYVQPKTAFRYVMRQIYKSFVKKEYIDG